jgi:hypothetical protein
MLEVEDEDRRKPTVGFKGRQDSPQKSGLWSVKGIARVEPAGQVKTIFGQWEMTIIVKAVLGQTKDKFVLVQQPARAINFTN